MNSNGAEETIRHLSENYPSLNIGAGTVCDKNDLKRAVKAGASFVVTPVVDEKVIKKCVKYKIYLDMLNSMWNESELVDLENAKKIIEENRERKERPFYEKQTVKIQTNEPNNSVPLGSLWCSKSHAQKGEILKILVKRILNDNIIEDKLGSLYQNNDLITVQEGKSIALAYWQNRREDIVDIINKSNADNQ
jgi:hypothetical protein